MKIYDLIIIGGSAAATSAGIYAARRGLDFKIITKDFGGEVATSGEIGNWPGTIETDGIALAKQFKNHLDYYKVAMEEGVEVKKITRSNGLFCISTGSDKKCDYLTKAVIIATGVHPKKLKVPGEKEFLNKGVSYCSVCDGPLFTGMAVATIGGGNSALESALMLADIASKVHIITIDPAFTGDEILVKNLKSKKNVDMTFNAIVTEITGNEFVSGLKYTIDGPPACPFGRRAGEAGKETKLAVSGIFIHIGMIPNNKIVPAEVEKNKLGEIVINKNCETNIPGLYAAGDVTDTPFKQIIVAAGQGTVAALSAVQYLNKCPSAGE